MVLDINPEDESSSTAQYHDAFPKDGENEYCDNHRRVPVNKPENLRSSSLVPSTTRSGSGQSSFDPSDLSSDDEEYLTPNNLTEMTPEGSDHATFLLTAARLNVISPPETPKNWG